MFSEEFENNQILPLSLGALIFGYFLVFYQWSSQSVITVDSYNRLQSFICPPYFQSCESLYFLLTLPEGYSQSILYMILFTALFWAVYLLFSKRWLEAQLILIPVFVWHTANVFLFTDIYSGNYEYYQFVFGVILLFLPHKVFFLKLSVVLLYIMSTIAKIHPAWIEGAYFTNMQIGLPLFPDWSIPVLTNLVLLMEMIGAWFLMSKNKFLQRSALVFFAIFHLYSGIIVLYRYPATVLPMVLILFGPLYKHSPVPFTKKSIISWVFVLSVFMIQFSPKLIYGDEKLTLEGNKYGLYMFESNHQCISEVEVLYKNGKTNREIATKNSARNRCSPYNVWFYYNQVCERSPEIERIAWTFDHSINGDPFLRIVDTENVCALEYSAFSHNQWIKTHSDNPEIIGLPVMNSYY